MILEALYISASNLVLGLFLAAALAYVFWRMGRDQRDFPEPRVAESVERVETETKEEEWTWPPRWESPKAETHFHDKEAV